MKPRKAADPIPPYGVAIQAAVATGDLRRMKALARETERYVTKFGDVATALIALNLEIAKLEAKGGRTNKPRPRAVRKGRS